MSAEAASGRAGGVELAVIVIGFSGRVLIVFEFPLYARGAEGASLRFVYVPQVPHFGGWLICQTPSPTKDAPVLLVFAKLGTTGLDAIFLPLQGASGDFKAKSDGRSVIPHELINPQLFCQGFPLPVHQRLRLSIHDNLIGPGTGEALGGPLAGGVYAHLRSIVGEAAGVVERVDGAQGELDVALGIDVV